MGAEMRLRRRSPVRVEIYKASDGWRWRAVAIANGLTLADGGQGYSRASDCQHGARTVCREPVEWVIR